MRVSRSRRSSIRTSLRGSLPQGPFRDRRDMLGRIAATAAGDIDQAATCKIAQIARHVRRSRSKRSPKADWATCIRVTRDSHIRFSESPKKWIHESGPREQFRPTDSGFSASQHSRMPQLSARDQCCAAPADAARSFTGNSCYFEQGRPHRRPRGWRPAPPWR